MTYKLVSKSTNTIISLEQAKAALNIDENDTFDDDLIDAIITSAIVRAENAMSRDLLTTTYENYRNSWDTDLTLRRGGYQSVESIEYLLNGAYTTLAATEYNVTIGGTFGEICEINIPTSDRVCNDIKITFKTGFGDTSADIPADIIQAIKTDIVFLYSNRGDCGCSNNGFMSPISSAIYNSYKIIDISSGSFIGCL